MAVIPPRVSSSERATRLAYLKDVKQKRFRYKDVSTDLPFPGLDPACIPQIMANQEDYWFDQNWIARNDERRAQAQSAYFAPPVGFPPNLESYGNVKEP